MRRIAKSDFEGHTLTLKVKFSDFTQITRSLTVQHSLLDKDGILPVAKRLLKEVGYSADRPIRLWVSLSAIPPWRQRLIVLSGWRAFWSLQTNINII